MELNIAKLSTNAIIPMYAKIGDAGLDLTATKIIKNGIFSVWYATDIAIKIPKNYYGALAPRSSISNDGALMLANGIGTIDSGYRLGIQVRFNRTIKGVFTRKQYKVGDRIAQIIISPFVNVKVNEVDGFTETERGGFGSTGK